ncbi:beta strand repeat-containing protein [uncultured Methylobacterium sp.]|uniref:beta strand repeat-containing protein n=1 Tax=uncultured Methylobacterium sp. TaxID=157278 RepID=UPI0035CB80E1
MALTADQLNTIYNNVLFRNVDAGGIQFFANRTDISDAQVRQQIELSPEATTYVTPIVRLYQAEFGRVPDVGGLKFFVQTYEQGGGTQNISVIAQQLLNSAEATSGSATVAGNTLNAGFVSTIYNNILGRTASTGEVNFWTGSGKTAAVVLAEITNSNESAQRNASGVVTFLDSAAVGSPNSGSLGSQTGSNGGSNAGTTFTLTTAIDNFAGTAGNDTFLGDANTTSAADQVNGGAGTDTLRLFATTTLPAINGIEVLDYVAPGNVSINVSNLSGLQTLKVEQVDATNGTTFTAGAGVALDISTANGVAAAGTVTFAASATDTTTNLTLSGFQGGTAVTPNDVTVTGAASTTLNVNGTTTKNAVGNLTAAATDTTVNINAATEFSATTLTAGAATKLNIAGAGKVTISASDLAATVTVDGSTNTGGVLFTDEAAGSTLTFRGGSGNDSVTFAATQFTVSDTLTGGAGTDTININDTTPVYAAINKATGFEALGLSSSGATVDISQITNGINSFKVNAGNLTETFNNALATSVFTIDNSAGNSGTVTVANKVGETATSVTVDYGAATAAKTLANLTVNGETTVNLTSTGTGTGGSNVITTLANADNSNIVITGSKDLTITSGLAATTTGSKIDASAFTGKLNVLGSGQADVIIGGSGNDTINGGAGKDTINGGAGNDTITVNTAASNDVITGGSGSDIFKFSGSNLANFAATSAGTTDIVSITDIVAGTDKISLVNTGTPFTAVNLANQTIATAADLTGVYAGITAVTGSTTTAQAVVLTVQGGAAAGTYLYVNDATGPVSNTADFLVKITGLTGTLAASDFQFT